MAELTRSQVRKLARAVSLLLEPERFGCRLDTGDPATAQERIGDILNDAVGVLEDVQSEVPAQHRGWFAGCASWRGLHRVWRAFPSESPRGRTLMLRWSNSTPEDN